MRIIERIKMWFTPHKHCRHCCLICRYYKYGKKEVITDKK